MVIISKTTLVNLSQQYPEVLNALNRWYEITKNSDWKNFNEMKLSFNSVDAVGNDRYVFNIKGNNYRLVVLIIFKVRTVFVLWFGNHPEYDDLNNTVGAQNIQFKN